ncbi:MAG TPA: nucleotide exchange factor GrpE [candidate division WOR-3 bacterium]|uniref:Protein GrpE n=1 Tax=candidate division WOR-3 bacterium TaxID=2052148 RepID=A0A9C9EKU4_UNCW3|nr:nucleotide exchange factor GrpE [candidate division WOR-3 bacterium]
MKRKGPVTRLKEELKEKMDEVKELNDKYLRAVAELDNYRKLMQKEMANYRRSCKVEFIRKLIPVLDSFDRALSSAEVSENFDNFYKGMEIIQRQLKESLKSMGLIEFSGLGEVFDPSRHEAVATIATDEHPEDMVVEEVSKGYIVDDQIVKPAKVFVSKQKKGGQEDAENNRD